MAKALMVLGSMLAGGDSIRNANLLRTGATDKLFDRVRAPSTIGTRLNAESAHGQLPGGAGGRDQADRLGDLSSAYGDAGSPLAGTEAQFCFE